MSLVLTPEDGSIVTGANTWATVAVCRAYNLQRGVTLPADDDVVAALLTNALDFMEGYEPRYKGNRVAPLLQALSWPRVNVYLYAGSLFPSTAIPPQLINAQCYLANVAQTIDLAAAQDTRAITKSVIGPIETDYDPKSGATLKPVLPQLDAMLQILCNSGTGILKSVRV